jgi:hypothetical protein
MNPSRTIASSGVLSLLLVAHTALAQICTFPAFPVNGCSTQKFEYLLPEVAVFRAIFSSQCNSHDVCYTSLGSNRATCDLSFRSATANKCDSTFNRWLQPLEWQTCMIASEGFYQAVAAFGPPYFASSQGDSAGKSRVVGLDVNLGHCGTTPQRSQLYSTDLLTFVSNKFAANSNRIPSVYEYFEAINSADVSVDRNNWELSVDQYSRSRASFQPPFPSVTVTRSDDGVTLTASSSAPIALYEWHINGQLYSGPTYNIYYSPSDYTIAIKGFLVASTAAGVRNLVVVDRVIQLQAYCPPPQQSCQ